jgi:hypothetical protein
MARAALTIRTGLWLTIGLTIPHLIYDLRPGWYGVTGPQGVYAYGPASDAGGIVFASPDSGAYRVQTADVSGVPEPPVLPPAPKSPSRCGRLGLEVIGLGLLGIRSTSSRFGGSQAR